MVQRKSARFVQSDYRHRSSVTRMLEGLKWEFLKDRRTICRLTMVFKILNGEVAIPSQEFFEFNCTRTRHGHPKKLTRYQPKTDVLKYTLAPITIPEWNDLTEEVVDDPSPLTASGMPSGTTCWVNLHPFSLHMCAPIGSDVLGVVSCWLY